MKLEDQVASLELCKRLKELGVKQESHFYRIKERGEWRLWPYSAPGFSLEGIREEPREDWEVYSAFTVAELGELLPFNARSFKYSISGKDPWTKVAVVLNSKDFSKEVKSEKVHWVCEVPRTGDVLIYDHFTKDTEADARAKMLIYLIENKLLKPESLLKENG